jgi:hypothetical protein
MHSKTVGLICLLSAASIFAAAQKNEVSVSVGAIATSDQTIQLQGVTCPVGVPDCAGPFTTSTSTSVAFEGDYVRQIFNFHLASVGAEFPILGVPSRDVTSGAVGGRSITSSMSSIFFTPSARINFFPSGSVSPFFSLGGGLAHHEAGSAVTHGALQFGGGVDFKTHLPHLGLRLEVRDFWAKAFAESSGILRVNPEHLHNVFAGGGVVFKF